LKIASALVVNVGTLSPDWTDGMRLAAHMAVKLGKPWILDPVGAGATPFRTKVCPTSCCQSSALASSFILAGFSGHLLCQQVILSLMDLNPTVIRGNASEIMAIAGAAGKTKGVDSTAQSADALEHGKQLARDRGCVVAISGATDLVTIFVTCFSHCRPESCCHHQFLTAYGRHERRML
jgi:hydroxyethylthiazole kinase